MYSMRDPGTAESDVTYPILVKYCGYCSMPVEYCEFSSEYEKCKEWLASNYPEDYEKLRLLEEAKDGLESSDAEKRRQKRGGKGLAKFKTDTTNDTVKRVFISVATRSGKKRITIVSGLAAFKVDLRAAAKFFGTKFACGSSVTAETNEIIIQGDVRDDLFKVIPEKWNEITMEAIENCGEAKKTKK